VADVFADAQTRVGFTSAIANIALPTTTELNAGILLHDVITDDGLVGFEATSAVIPTTPLSGQFDTNFPGRDSFSGRCCGSRSRPRRTRSSTPSPSTRPGSSSSAAVSR
jgi:hypothetical protein